jgi:hypothetical protein
MELQINLADRLRVAARAIRGVFKQPTPQDLLGVYAGLFPGGPGSPPPRGMAELIKSYADMPWLHAVVGKIASGVASAEWKVFVVRNADRRHALAILQDALDRCRDEDMRTAEGTAALGFSRRAGRIWG